MPAVHLNSHSKLWDAVVKSCVRCANFGKAYGKASFWKKKFCGRKLGRKLGSLDQPLCTYTRLMWEFPVGSSVMQGTSGVRTVGICHPLRRVERSTEGKENFLYVIQLTEVEQVASPTTPLYTLICALCLVR
jgi:hypothetical protein